MNISEKRYPYPVLSPTRDDYDQSSAFDVSLEFEKSPAEVTLTFAATLKDDGLRQLIGGEGAAKIIVHVEAPKTVFRRTYDIPLPYAETAVSEKDKRKVPIPAAELSGLVSVCPFIVATRDIPDYGSESFNPDYEGASFAIDEGAVLAEGRQKTFFVDTSAEALDASRSIFTITQQNDPAHKTIQADFAGDRIEILMPLTMYKEYAMLKDSAADREALWAMVVVPALVEVLTTLGVTKRFESAVMSEYATLRWYGAIDKGLRAVFGWGIDSPNFDKASYTELASLLVKNSVKTAINTMKRGFGEDPEE